jgi:nitronate monooxygenase
MKFETPLSKRLGLKYPIVAAPMFLISNKEMLVACAEAGVLGCMPSLNARTAEQFKADLSWIRAKTTKPFGINLTLGLTPPERIEADLQLCFEFEVPVICTSYGNPTEVAKRAHEKKALVFHDVIGIAHGKKAVAAGVDAIIAVAAGAGGHAGRISPFVLYPWLKQELKVPIIAAGCISDGRQVVSALTLGAELCYLGTRFIATAECGASPAYKDKVTHSTPDDLVYTDAVSGIHANFFKDTIPEGFTPDRSPSGAKRWKDVWSAGQGVALIHEVKPISAVVEDLMREAHDALTALAG